jgi:hypothetical protein
MNYTANRPKTIFCDIDGTLVQHFPPSVSCTKDHNMIILDGTLEKINEWNMKGHHIVLTTGRKECTRSITMQQLAEVGIIYDQLIMGIPGGERILINDNKPDGTKSATHFNIERNKGIKDICV